MKKFVGALGLTILGSMLCAPAHAHAPSGQITARTTAYCLTGVTRSGEWTRPGVVAVDPALIPLYSTLTIEGLSGEYTALDTGGGVHGAHVDLWLSDCGEAIRWGSQYRL